MNLKPLGDRVIVKRDEAESATSAGLLIASTSKEKPQTGIVVAVGEGKLDKDGKLVPVPVKAGDRVATRQSIGRIYSDVENRDETVLHFQLWREKRKLNPLVWLD